jgi:hypothetical protein
MFFRVPLSAYFFMYPYGSTHLLQGIVQHACIIDVFETQGGFVLALFQGWSGEWNILEKYAALISAFLTSL